MELYELKPFPGSRHKKKRVGRGESSGWGKTAGRGHKGQNARSGGGVPPDFEGGQMPLKRRLPKFGFSNALFRKEYAEVNVEKLNRFEDGTVVDPELLMKTGIVKKLKDGVKILGKGELKKKLTVKAHKFSESAKDKILAAGGQIEIIK